MSDTGTCLRQSPSTKEIWDLNLVEDMDTDMAPDIVANMEEVQVMHSPDMDTIPMVLVPVDTDLVDRANREGILDKEELEQLMVDSTLTMEDIVVLDMEDLIKELIKELRLVHLEVVLLLVLAALVVSCHQEQPESPEEVVLRTSYVHQIPPKEN